MYIPPLQDLYTDGRVILGFPSRMPAITRYQRFAHTLTLFNFHSLHLTRAGFKSRHYGRVSHRIRS